MTDLEFLTWIRSGDQQLEDKGLLALFLRNKLKIQHYVGKNQGTEEEAEEVIQDALVVVFFNMRKPAFELTAKVDTYLFAVAKNIWYKKLRAKMRDLPMVDLTTEGLNLGFVVQDELLSREDQPILRLLEMMSSRCKEVLTMIFVADLGIKEIVAQLGYGSEQAVRNKKSECLAGLKKLYEQYKGQLRNG